MGDNNKYIQFSGYDPLHRDFPKSYFNFYKRKERKDFKRSFPDYTLPTCLFSLQVKGTDAIKFEKKEINK